MRKPIKGRTCGPCTACCYAFQLKSIEKPEDEWCPDCAIGVGCKRYNSRPRECRVFTCDWVTGEGEDGDRPDKGNCIVAQVHVPQLGNTLVAYEMVLGAYDRSSFAQEKVRSAMLKFVPVWLRRMHQQDKLFLPEHTEISFVFQLECAERKVEIHRY